MKNKIIIGIALFLMIIPIVFAQVVTVSHKAESIKAGIFGDAIRVVCCKI